MQFNTIKQINKETIELSVYKQILLAIVTICVIFGCTKQYFNHKYLVKRNTTISFNMDISENWIDTICKSNDKMNDEINKHRITSLDTIRDNIKYTHIALAKEYKNIHDKRNYIKCEEIYYRNGYSNMLAKLLFIDVHRRILTVNEIHYR